jgi:hypothetical protein
MAKSVSATANYSSPSKDLEEEKLIEKSLIVIDFSQEEHKSSKNNENSKTSTFRTIFDFLICFGSLQASYL